MDEFIEDLVLAPFRDIVAQGRIASDNADEAGNDGMRTVAQNVIKEGERALKRLEPPCRKMYNVFGAAFVNSLKDDEEISRHIEHLKDLLYDFEEFVEADSFDEEKFVELQACSRKAAPAISHRVTRFKLLPREDEDPITPSSPASAFAPMVLVRQPFEEGSLQHEVSLPYPDDTDGERKVKLSKSWPPGQEPEARQTESPVTQVLRLVQEDEHSLRPLPSPDLWSQRSQDIEQGLKLIAQRQRRISNSDSAIGIEANLEHTSSHSLRKQPTSSLPAVPPKSPYRILTPPTPGPSFEQTAKFIRSHHGRESVTPLSPLHNRASLASSGRLSLNSPVSDHRSCERESHFDGVSPMTPTDRTSEEFLDSRIQEPDQENSKSKSPHVRPLFAQSSISSAITVHVTEGLEPVVLPAPVMIPDGLMLVEAEANPPLWPVAALEKQLGGCAISFHSSYYQHGGFCKGAMEIMQGGLGIKRIKKQGLSRGNIEAAKCKACAYELEWKAVERDLKNEATENFQSEGIGFRLRFLSKSHLPSKSKDEQTYGCLLCVQVRHTTHPNDATVFFSQKQLFAHLARHPRPVLHVPGLTVVQSKEMPGKFANNYDLHFSGQPRASNFTNIMRDVAALPIATTIQTYRPSQVRTVKRPTDSKQVLCFAAGARILGVQFPEKYKGTWCVGWANHQYGLIMAETIRLDLPNEDSRPKHGSSSMQAVARWRFATKDSKDAQGEEWLSFSQGEVLTDISWSHQEHWCWSGTNAKGKSGLFPRSHIEPGTLTQVAAQSDCVSIASDERKTGLLARLSIRHRSRSDGGGGRGGGGGGGGRAALSPQASIY